MANWRPYLVALAVLFSAGTASAQVLPVDFLQAPNKPVLVVGSDDIFVAELRDVCTAWAPCEESTIVVEPPQILDAADLSAFQANLRSAFAGVPWNEQDQPEFVFAGLSELDPTTRTAVETVILNEAETATIPVQVDFLE